MSIITYLCFHETIGHEFSFDDHVSIGRNNDLNSISDNSLWWNDIWGSDIGSPYSHKSYRPFLIKTFQIINHYAGGKVPKYFRLISIASHTITSVLIIFLAEIVTAGDLFTSIGAGWSI